MMLGQQKRGADARRLAEEDTRMLRGMQHVDEEAHVEQTILKRQRVPVKMAACDFAARSHHELNALERNVRAKLGDETADGAVAAANIQHGCACGDFRRKYFGKDTGTTLKHESTAPPDHPR